MEFNGGSDFGISEARLASLAARGETFRDARALLSTTVSPQSQLHEERAFFRVITVRLYRLKAECAIECDRPLH